MNNSTYLSIDDVARELGITRRTITRWIAGRLLPATKLSAGQSGRIRIRRDDLEAFLAVRVL